MINDHAIYNENNELTEKEMNDLFDKYKVRDDVMQKLEDNQNGQ